MDRTRWWSFGSRANFGRLRRVSSELKSGFSFHAEVASRVTPDLLWSLLRPAEAAGTRGCRTSVFEVKEPPARVSRVTLVFVIDLYSGVPGGPGRLGTSPVKLTNHFPEAIASNTLTFDNRLTVRTGRRRSF
jgi:hypothetical protein